MQFLGAINQVASLGAFKQNTKVVGKPHRFGRHRRKIGPNANILAYFPRTHEQGQICICGFVSTMGLGKKLLRF